MIDWSAFTWEAFATLATGFAAVGGAVFLGVRQIGISRRQAEIADRQTQILEGQLRVADLGHRYALLDRRLSVFDGVRDYVASILTHARPPAGKEHVEFHGALALARFVFSDAVNERLDVVFRKALDFQRLTIRMRGIRENRGAWNGEPEQESELLEYFFDLMGRLPELFGDEIKAVA